MATTALSTIMVVAERASDLLQGQSPTPDEAPVWVDPHWASRQREGRRAALSTPPCSPRAGAFTSWQSWPSPFATVGFASTAPVVGTATLIAILFTSGLTLASFLPCWILTATPPGRPYQFANPLAIESRLGFLGLGLYFLSAAYFCLFEPRLKLFEHPWVKTLHNGIIQVHSKAPACVFVPTGWFRTISQAFQTPPGP